PLALLDQLGGLEAVELRHLHVEEDHRHVRAGQQDPQRVLARRGREQLMPERLQDRLERDEVLAPVVDEQDGRHQTPTCSTLSPTSSSASSASPATRADGTAASAAAGISVRSALVGSCTSAVPP